jgi:hypothetical protein
MGTIGELPFLISNLVKIGAGLAFQQFFAVTGGFCSEYDCVPVPQREH